MRWAKVSNNNGTDNLLRRVCESILQLLEEKLLSVAAHNRVLSSSDHCSAQTSWFVIQSMLSAALLSVKDIRTQPDLRERFHKMRVPASIKLIWNRSNGNSLIDFDIIFAQQYIYWTDSTAI